MVLANHALWAQEAKEFFQILFHQLAADERIEVRYKLPGAEQKMQREFVRTPDQAARLTLAKGHSHDVYAGVAPRQGNVGTKEGVTRLLTLWGDLDVKGHHTSARRLEQLDGLSCSPSILVWSGGGYHPYGLLEQQAKGSHELDRAERIMARIAEGMDGDAVHDRSRRCAVCDISAPQLLDAAHLRPKREHGSDDPRNGLVLCASHHRALDAGLFAIEPNSLRIRCGASGPDADSLRLDYSTLEHLPKKPHREALEWLWNKWR